MNRLVGWVGVLSAFVCQLGYAQVTRYVNVSNATPVAPYVSWADAATNIKDAVEAALIGEPSLDTDGAIPGVITEYAC